MMSNQLPEAEIAQTEKIGLGDLIIVGVIAALTWFFATLWEFPGLLPTVWNDATVAAGVRPASSVVPGYWTFIASRIYNIFGNSAAPAMLRFFGHLCLAGIAVCVYAVLREWLAFAMRARPQMSKRRTFVQRIAAALGSVAFVAADPVWSAGQCLSETTILLVLSLLAIEFFFVFLRKGTIKYAYICAILLGLLSAETPMGLILTALFIFVNSFIIKMMPTLESPFFDPSIMEVGKWHMTFIFLASIVAGVVLNCVTYLGHDALGTAGEIPLDYLLGYWSRIANAASPGAWVMWLGICLLPFVVATIKFPESADEEQFLSYASGLIFFCCGLVVLSQSASLSALWFWTYLPVNSQFLLSIGLFCCAATLALSVTILGVDSLCRDHKRLAEQAFGAIPMQGEEDEDDEEESGRGRAFGKAGENLAAARSTNILRLCGMIVILIAALGVMAPGRVKTGTRAMLQLVQDAIGEIIEESGEAKYLFTDGNLDAAIELEAVKRGLPIRCYSLMGGPGALEVFLRLRGMDDSEDQFSFKFDTAMGLRSWIRDRPQRLAESAVMMGFDLWKRDGKPLPPMGGLVSRPSGFASNDEADAYAQRGRQLASRIIELQKSPDGVKSCTDAKIVRAFETVQWRLSRMCTYRSEVYDRAGRVDEAIEDVTLAKDLNELNGIYKDLVAAMEKRNEMMMQKLTPREGLQLALVRADFTMGKLYAETILGADPENPDGNFAMGMYYMQEGQLSRAERYLLRCLIRKPNEPAVYNNLAMIQLELKKYAAAKSNVEKALKILPDSAAILDTKKAIDAAIEESKK